MSSKKNVLKVLENNKGESVSGETIAAELSISRSAVWKAIQELKKDGYEITAITNKGYSLALENDILSLEGIIPHVNDESIIKNIFVYDQVESTNSLGKQLSFTSKEPISVIIANKQTKGVGRKGRSFFSPADTGVYISFLIKPNIDNESSLLITTAASVAVSKAIETVTNNTANVGIKWVNDLYIKEKKVCGILTEAVTNIETNNIEWIILGIGINTEISHALPADLKPIVGAINTELNEKIDRNYLAGTVINEICKMLKHFSTGDFIEEYKARSIIIGEDINVIKYDTTYEAKAMDITETGGLVVQLKNGETEILNSGEITIRKINTSNT